MAAAWTQTVLSLLPMVLAFIPKLPPSLIPAIIQGIQEAEQLPGAKGPEKKAHVLALVDLAIQGVNAAKHKVVLDPATVTPVVNHAIDVGIAVANLLTKHR